MTVIEKKRKKMRDLDRDDLDYDELTVSEGEFDDEEQKKFHEYLKDRRNDIAQKAEKPKEFDDTPY